MGLYSWLLANSYDLVMRKTEQLGLANWRSQLLAHAHGDILEIGAGTGSNLPHYPAARKLILCEPDRQMRRKLNNKLIGNTAVHVSDWPAENLKAADQSIDTVVSTLVLCSVNNQQHALREIFRVLRPGGQLLFIEHVHSDQAGTARWQKLCEPFWRCACGNCHLTRATGANISEQGFLLEELQEETLAGAPAIVGRTFRGRARKPLSIQEPAEQNFNLRAAPPCPRCQSQQVAKILYGNPPLTREILAGLEAGKIISGGCMLHGGAPQWHCHQCQHSFGEQWFDPSRNIR
jgi:SAM-dependent methyltransferase